MSRSKTAQKLFSSIRLHTRVSSGDCCGVSPQGPQKNSNYLTLFSNQAKTELRKVRDVTTGSLTNDFKLFCLKIKPFTILLYILSQIKQGAVQLLDIRLLRYILQQLKSRRMYV